MKIKLSPRERRKKEAIAGLSKPIATTLINIDGRATLPPNYPLTTQELVRFIDKIQGEIDYPWSPGYDAAKTEQNPIYSVSPEMIVFAAGYDDVRACLALAQQHNLSTTIRTGRHSLADYSVCEGIVIDISNLKSVQVHLDQQTVWVQAGITFEDLNPALEFYNMHLPGGGCPTVAVAGYMQGGGYGFTARNYGMHSDCVIQFTMMLADGTVVIANPNQNSDLFWAVRGGTGGNFGVLLDITYKIFPLDNIWGVAIEWEFETGTTNAAQALLTIQNNYLTGFQYPNLGIQTVVYTDFAPGHDGYKKVRFCGSFIGEQVDLNTAIAPLLAIPGATQVYSAYDKYSVINNALIEGIPAFGEDTPDYLPPKYFGRSAYVAKSLSLEDYANILSMFKTIPNQFGMMDFEGYGGAINQYPREESAFIHRSPIMDVYTIAFFSEGATTNDREANETWINNFYEFLNQYWNGHSYQNYPYRQQENFQWAYWGEYYGQLCAVKGKYDPNNFFNYQQSIGSPLSPELAAKQKIIFANTPIIREKY